MNQTHLDLVGDLDLDSWFGVPAAHCLMCLGLRVSLTWVLITKDRVWS